MREDRGLRTDGDAIVSIVTAYYNGGEFFEQTFNSVMNQTFPWFEWIIVNDGSTNDEDVKIIEVFAEKDERIRIIHKDNGGASSARNAGIRESKGKYIVPLDCDDLIEPTFLEYCWWMLEHNDEAAWSYSGSCGFQGQEYLWDVPFNPIIEKTKNHLTVTSMFRKSAIEKCGLFLEEAKYYNEDWALFLRLIAGGEKCVQSMEYLQSKLK